MRGDTPTIPRPFTLNLYVFDDEGNVTASASKGKLTSLIESERYTTSNFVRRFELGLAEDFSLYNELNAPGHRRSGLPNFIMQS